MIRILNGDCLTELPKLAAAGERFHACVTDPPYHLTSGNAVYDLKLTGAGNARVRRGSKGGFMGKEWDGGDIAFRPETWRKVYDCLLPGAYLLAFASTRGYHRMVCAIEDAGFIIHPLLGWIFASGFPKASRFQCPDMEGFRYGLQSLKPALEPICLAQKPMEGTGTANVLKHGCGGLNIDASRVPASVSDVARAAVPQPKQRPHGRDTGHALGSGAGRNGDVFDMSAGRWPANVIIDDSQQVADAFAAFGESKSGADQGKRGTGGIWSASSGTPCGPQYGDTGTAARFFFCAKADATDRADSKHPTVKPTELMRYLVRLVTPPGGTVLDPFAGSGSTLLAADQLGFNAVGIEMDPTYAEDARRKITRDAGMFAEVETNAVQEALL